MTVASRKSLWLPRQYNELHKKKHFFLLHNFHLFIYNYIATFCENELSQSFFSRVSINSHEKIWCRSVLKNYCWQQLQSWVLAIWGRIICSALSSKLPLIWHHNILLKNTLWKNMYMFENICSVLYSKLPHTSY